MFIHELVDREWTTAVHSRWATRQDALDVSKILRPMSRTRWAGVVYLDEQGRHRVEAFNETTLEVGVAETTGWLAVILKPMRGDVGVNVSRFDMAPREVMKLVNRPAKPGPEIVVFRWLSSEGRWARIPRSQRALFGLSLG